MFISNQICYYKYWSNDATSSTSDGPSQPLGATTRGHNQRQVAAAFTFCQLILCRLAKVLVRICVRVAVIRISIWSKFSSISKVFFFFKKKKERHWRKKFDKLSIFNLLWVESKKSVKGNSTTKAIDIIWNDTKFQNYRPERILLPTSRWTCWPAREEAA